MIFGGNGIGTNIIGNVDYSNDGKTMVNVGDMSYTSDGTTIQKVGNMYYDSNGTAHNAVGSTLYGSDGTPLLGWEQIVTTWPGILFSGKTRKTGQKMASPFLRKKSVII